jgi:hypothetical protein
MIFSLATKSMYFKKKKIQQNTSTHVFSIFLMKFLIYQIMLHIQNVVKIFTYFYKKSSYVEKDDLFFTYKNIRRKILIKYEFFFFEKCRVFFVLNSHSFV